MDDVEKIIYADASQPAWLNNGNEKVLCLTLQEAVIAWRRLLDRERERATVSLRDGTVYSASEIERLHKK